MPNLDWNEITHRAELFADKWDGETYEKGESQSFWSDFLNVFGIDRKRHGAYFEYAIKKNGGTQGFIDLFWPGKLLAEQKSAGRDLAAATLQALDYLPAMPDADLPEAIVVSDFANFELRRLTSRETERFTLADFPTRVRRFEFLIGESRTKAIEEDPVNRKAAESMAALHNQLAANGYAGHDLERFLVRLVFCLFADDARIFTDSALQQFIRHHTQLDGTDLGPLLVRLFEVLNTPKEKRQRSLAAALATLPYVNGGLFDERIATPDFTSSMRLQLLQSAELDWSKVSPAIFGAMFQGVMDEKQRRNLGAHYTSETNILKVIKPLFLDDLYAEFVRVQDNPDALHQFHDKLAALTFLDPACGCGNFLVITYRELRRLEHLVVQKLVGGTHVHDLAPFLRVNVGQMYGIEIEEFPALIAQTALWLTDHQMNLEASRMFGQVYARLPLTESGNIANVNALTTDWADIVPPEKLGYILGNPPFIGSKLMTATMRNELVELFPNVRGSGTLDFVCAWYAKATVMMEANRDIRSALVSTNSITQGEQVGVLWRTLLEKGVQIDFAHRTFRWMNEARGVAAVYCVVIGFSLTGGKQKLLFDYPDIRGEPIEIKAANINPYLVDAVDVLVTSRSNPLGDVPQMSFGNMPNDDGNLFVTELETTLLPSTVVRPFLGAYEFINGKKRYCIWLVGADPSEIRNSQILMERLAAIRTYRSNSTRAGTRKIADTPGLFGEIRQPSDGSYVLVPRHSSENRAYIPIGLVLSSVIVGDSCMFVPNISQYHFGILTSAMHMAWVRSVCGRLKSDYRYSKDIVYNNFPWPENVTDQRRERIETLAQAVLDARAAHPTATLADLYDPNTMPLDLVRAHQTLDRAVDRLYRPSGFETELERVEFLFAVYQRLATAAQAERVRVSSS